MGQAASGFFQETCLQVANDLELFIFPNPDGDPILICD